MAVNILQVVITITKVKTVSSSNCKCYKLHTRMINMDAMFSRRWVSNVHLLIEQIQRYDFIQKMVAKVPDEFLTLLAHSTTRRHIKNSVITNVTAVRTSKLPHIVLFPAEILI